MKKKPLVLTLSAAAHLLLAITAALALVGWKLRDEYQKKLKSEKRTYAALTVRKQKLEEEDRRLSLALRRLGGRRAQPVSAETFVEKTPLLKPFFRTSLHMGNLPEVGIFLIYSPPSGWLEAERLKEVLRYLEEVFGEKRVMLLKLGPPAVFGVLVRG